MKRYQNKKKNENSNKESNQEKTESPSMLIKDSEVDTKIENIEDVKKNIDKKINLSQINSGWEKVLKIIEKKNSKTAGFLEDIFLENLNSGILKIGVNNISNFIFKGLLNDVKLIEDSLFEFFKSRIKVTLVQGKVSENKLTKTKTEQKDHPLFMDALNKFKGEVLR